MSHLHTRSPRGPFSALGVLMVILLAFASIPIGTVSAAPARHVAGGARPQAQACETLESPASRASSASRDRWKFTDEATLTNGTVVGYNTYWYPEPDSSAELFRATTSDDALFQATDFEAGTPLGTVWEGLCPILAGLGSIVEQGIGPSDSIDALMTIPVDGGGENWGLARVHYGYGTDVPVMGLLIAPAASFSVALGDASGLGFNGIRVFEDIDADALLATLEGGAPPAQETAAQEATLGSGTVVTWSEPWGDPYLEPNSVNLVTADTTVFNVDAYPAAEQTLEDVVALTPAGDYTVFDSGPDVNGGLYQLSGLTMLDPMQVEVRTWFVYSRVWPSADGQWIIATQLQSVTPFFTRDLASIPDTITLDGAPLWADVDVAAIVDTVVEAGVDMSSEAPVPPGTQGSGPTSAETPEAGDTGSGGGTSTRGSSSGEVPGASPRDVLANVPLGGAVPQTAQDGSYTSDLYGYTVEWAGPWEIYDDWTEVDPDTGYDTLGLRTPDDRAALVISGAAWDDQYSVDDYVAYWTSDEYLSKYQPEGTEVILADASRRSGAVVMVGPASENDDEPWVTVFEVQVVGRELEIDVSFFAPVDGFGTAYEDAIASVTLDGDEVMGYFTTEEIVAELP